MRAPGARRVAPALLLCATSLVTSPAVPHARADAQAPAAAAKAADSTGKAVAVADFAIPEIPATTFLDASGAKITRPITARDFQAAVVNALDERGNVRQGVAFELRPTLLSSRSHISLRDYRTRAGFLKWNWRLSFATVQTAGDTGSTDAALGMRVTVFDDGDPMRNSTFTDKVGDAMKRCAPESPTDTLSDPEVARRCLAAGWKPYVDAWRAKQWNARSLSFAAAAGVRFAESRLNRSAGTGARAWGVYGAPLGTWGQALLYGAYDYRRGDGEDSTYHAVSPGTRLLVGSPRLNGFAEAVYRFRSRESGSTVDATTGTWSGGIEFLAGRDLWLSTGVGGRYADADAPDRMLVFAGLRWGISSKARLNPVP